MNCSNWFEWHVGGRNCVGVGRLNQYIYEIKNSSEVRKMGAFGMTFLAKVPTNRFSFYAGSDVECLDAERK
jgi:hypothetical protein